MNEYETTTNISLTVHVKEDPKIEVSVFDTFTSLRMKSVFTEIDLFFANNKELIKFGKLINKKIKALKK